MFGISISLSISILDIASSNVYGAKKDSNLFLFIFSYEILWYL